MSYSAPLGHNLHFKVSTCTSTGKAGLAGLGQSDAWEETDKQGQAHLGPGTGPPPVWGSTLSKPVCQPRAQEPEPQPPPLVWCRGARAAVYLPPGADSEKAGRTRREGR